MFTKKDLDALVAADIDPAVSIFMFTHMAGRSREPASDDEDLLNYAAVHTLKTGGEVGVVPKEKMPRGGVAAAILRYGFDPDAPFEKSPG